MSFKHEQAARHAQLSAYCAEGNHEARDRMIASIERAGEEHQKVLRVIAAFVAVVMGGTWIVLFALRLFG